jgi:hypothetical protein
VHKRDECLKYRFARATENHPEEAWPHARLAARHGEVTGKKEH